MTRSAAPIRMAHVGLTVRVDEFDRVSSFYQEVFGWTVERELHGDFGHHQFLTDGSGSHIELIAREVIERPKPTPEPPGHICFAVRDDQFDALLERARRTGVAVGDPNVSTPDSRREVDARTGDARTGGRMSRYIFIDDPSGNCIEISTGAYLSLGLS